MWNIQEIEEAEFTRMGPAEEARWQHSQGLRCSFDCAACDPHTADDDLFAWQWELEQMTLTQLDALLAEEWAAHEASLVREFAPVDHVWF